MLKFGFHISRWHTVGLSCPIRRIGVTIIVRAGLTCFVYIGALCHFIGLGILFRQNADLHVLKHVVHIYSQYVLKRMGEPKFTFTHDIIEVEPKC